VGARGAESESGAEGIGHRMISKPERNAVPGQCKQSSLSVLYELLCDVQQ
jgi:hypothetical protein